MSDQGLGQSEPSTRDAIRNLLSPPQPEQPIEPPAEEVPSEATEEPQVTEPQEEVPETDPTEGWEEVEINGARFSVPPEIAEKVTKAVMQERDYTQKTQTLADEKRAVAAREEAIKVQQEALAQMQPLIARGQAIDQQLQELQKQLTTQNLEVDDPLKFASLSARWGMLSQQRQELIRTFERGKEYFAQQRQAAMAKAAEAAKPVLMKAIPDWGPDKDVVLTKYAVSQGLAPEDLYGLAAKPGFIVALEKARKYDELQASKAQLPKKVQGLSPVAKPGAKSTAEASGAASYRKNLEQLRKSGGKDKSAIRNAIKAKLGT